MVLVAIVLLLIGQSSALQFHCDYGRTSGTWRAIGPNIWTWQSFDTKCSLTNELGLLAETACEVPESDCDWPSEVFTPLRQAWNFTKGATSSPTSQQTRAARILVVGDSLDRYFGFDVCGMAGMSVLPFAPVGLPSCNFHTDRGSEYQDCMTCKMPGLIYSKEAAFSIHMSGPLERGLQGLADERAVKVTARAHCSNQTTCM